MKLIDRVLRAGAGVALGVALISSGCGVGEESRESSSENSVASHSPMVFINEGNAYYSTCAEKIKKLCEAREVHFRSTPEYVDITQTGNDKFIFNVKVGGRADFGGPAKSAYKQKLADAKKTLEGLVSKPSGYDVDSQGNIYFSLTTGAIANKNNAGFVLRIEDASENVCLGKTGLFMLPANAARYKPIINEEIRPWTKTPKGLSYSPSRFYWDVKVSPDAENLLFTRLSGMANAEVYVRNISSGTESSLLPEPVQGVEIDWVDNNHIAIGIHNRESNKFTVYDLQNKTGYTLDGHSVEVFR